MKREAELDEKGVQARDAVNLEEEVADDGGKVICKLDDEGGLEVVDEEVGDHKEQEDLSYEEQDSSADVHAVVDLR